MSDPASRGAAEIADFWRVSIVEDHLLQRQRTEEVLGGQDGLRIVSSHETLPQFITWLRDSTPATRPHLLVLDLQVDRGEKASAEAVRALIDAGLRVLVLSAFASPAHVREILRAGVSGFVGKRDSEQDLVAAVWTVLGRKTWMTPEMAWIIAGDDSRPKLSGQEERALVLYASGLTLTSVAESLGVTRDTAKRYLERVKDKYEAAGRSVRTKVDMTHAAVLDGYIDPSDPSPGRGT